VGLSKKQVWPGICNPKHLKFPQGGGQERGGGKRLTVGTKKHKYKAPANKPNRNKEKGPNKEGPSPTEVVCPSLGRDYFGIEGGKKKPKAERPSKWEKNQGGGKKKSHRSQKPISRGALIRAEKIPCLTLKEKNLSRFHQANWDIEEGRIANWARDVRNVKESFWQGTGKQNRRAKKNGQKAAAVISRSQANKPHAQSRGTRSSKKKFALETSSKASTKGKRIKTNTGG